MTERPNILFVLTDQHRGDCIGADPHSPTDADGFSLLHTPNLDALTGKGTLFTRCYTPAPSSIPARRCLLTGQTPATNGCPGWTETPWKFSHTLPGELAEVGYQTKLVGKIHSIPNRNACGFEDMEQHEGLGRFPDDDYIRWLSRQSDGQFDELSHGLGRNSWDARPSHLPEHLHPTTWTTERALSFLETRDPTRPFFLNLSYVRPHTPFDPPQVYWDMYTSRDLSEPYMGDWVDDTYGALLSEQPPLDAWVADLSPTRIHRARTGYYGSITHIDQQLKRVFDTLRQHGELANTFVLMTSDHGEMLGDHHLWRKTYGFEGSARVPLLVRPPASMGAPCDRFVDAPVGLEDIMPTLLSVAGADIPETVEGRNLLGLLSKNGSDRRAYYHGEHAPIYHAENATQYLVNEETKYIWNPVTGDEFLFDLDDDPGETMNLVGKASFRDDRDQWRERLAERLSGRTEGFIENGGLSTVPPKRLDPET